MNRSLILMSPRILSLRNRMRRGQEGSGLRVLAMSVVAVGFWVGIFYGFSRVLGYFQAAEGFGNMLARKLMGMTWLTFLGILLFSNVITALNTFFLSKDLETIHSAPLETEDIFWARFVDTLVDSSWMVVFFGMPVFLAYGVVYGAGFSYYLLLVATALPIMIMGTSLAVMFTMFLVNIFPARRTKDILFLLSITAVILLYLMFRLMRPERLVNPDDFSSAVRYFAALSTPSSPYLPHYWASEILWPSLVGGYSDAGFHLAMIISTALALAVFASWTAQILYPYGYSKSQEGARQMINRFHPVEYLVKLMGRPFHEQSRVLIAKDIRTFFRDNTQWSQLLLLLALIVIYLYNFSVLDLRRYPIKAFYLQNIISFLNIGLAAFVVASLGVRFVFPAVSQEGFSYWIIRSSPISLRRFLWTKYWIYAPPLIIVAEILIVLSNYLLDVSAVMMVLSTVTVFFLVLGIVSLGIGLGAVYPRFEAENMAQVATGFGGMIFMILSALYVAAVVVLEAWPVAVLLRSQASGLALTWWRIALIAVCFTAVLAINLAAVFVPMRYGRRHLLAREAIE